MFPSPMAARISITDRCDLACVYCRPAKGDACISRERRLDLGAWREVFQALARQGVQRLRITGGEPLLHPEIVSLVHLAATTPGIVDIALTTNGTRLEHLALPLRDAGLSRLNISVDSLHEDRFTEITRGGSLLRVLVGVSAAMDAGFHEIKTNTVVMRHSDEAAGNHDELVNIVRWAWSWGLLPRLIELMPLGVASELEAQYVPYAEMRASLVDLLGPQGEDDAQPDANRGPARYALSLDGSARRVGFITGRSEPFCEGCDRIRVTSDGTVRSCLARMEGVDASVAARCGDTEELARAVQTAWSQKPDGQLWRGTIEGSARRVSMRVIGG